MAMDARLVEAERLERYSYEVAAGEDADYELADMYGEDAYALRHEVRAERLSATWHGRLALRLERLAGDVSAWDRTLLRWHWDAYRALQGCNSLDYAWCWRLALPHTAWNILRRVNRSRLTYRWLTGWENRAWLATMEAYDCLRGEGCAHGCLGTYVSYHRRWVPLPFRTLANGILALARRLGGENFALPT